MDIRWEHGRLALNSANANYSFNQLHKVLQKALLEVNLQGLPEGDVLNLGMGAGSSVSILRDELASENKIISVEYDPQIIQVAEQYFNIDRFDDHVIHEGDAMQYLSKNTDNYSLIIVDLFKDRSVDDRFKSAAFFQLLHERLKDGGVMCFNYVGAEPHPLSKYVPSADLVEYKDNQVLIYRKTERS
jgi:spermidine synthase